MRPRRGRYLGHARPAEARILQRALHGERQGADHEVRERAEVPDGGRHRQAGRDRYRESGRQQRAIRTRRVQAGEDRHLRRQHEDLRRTAEGQRRRDDLGVGRDDHPAEAAPGPLRGESGQAVAVRRDGATCCRAATSCSRRGSTSGCILPRRPASTTARLPPGSSDIRRGRSSWSACSGGGGARRAAGKRDAVHNGARTERALDYPHAPVYPQSVQKSHPSFRIIALFPHSGHFFPGSVLYARFACSASGTSRMPAASTG